MAISWSGFELDGPARRLTGPDGAVHVEPQVFDVLVHLIEHRGRVVSKEELLDSVWGDQFVSESALTTRIKNARRALGDDGRTQRFIRNVHGRGYQFVGEITYTGNQPSPRPVTGDPPAPRAVALASSIAVDDEFAFAGRREEIEQLLALRRDAPGAARLFLGGAPGVGKSRLSLQVVDELESDGVVACAGRCEPYVTSSLQSVRDALAQLALAMPAEFIRWGEGLEPQLLGLLPGLVDLFPVEPAIVDSYAGVQILLTVVDRASAEQPIAVLVDDLHWSDELTRTFLARLHRQLAGRPVTTIATFRSGPVDLPGEVKRFISEQVRARDALRIDLDRLDDDAGRELVSTVLGQQRADEADDLIAHTGGNVLFLTETLRDLARGGGSSGSVTELVGSRLEPLSDEIKDLVRAGALLGPEFTFSVASAAAELDPRTALAAIDEAVGAELLHETASPNRFRFSHQLIPEAILDGMSGPARSLGHHRCARSLEGQGADEVEISFHLLGAVPLVKIEDALARTRAAAEDALDRKQFDRAIRLLTRAIDSGIQTRQRAEILVQIGRAMVDSGRSEGGVPFFEDAAELARRNGWTDILVSAALGHFGQSPFRKPTDHRTLELLAEAEAALGDESSVDRARVLAKTAAFSLFSTRLADREDMIGRALQMAVDAGPEDRLELLEYGTIVLSCPAGMDRVEALDAEIERLRGETDRYFSDAAAPETALLAHGKGVELRRVGEVEPDRILAQPIAEWRDLVLRSTFAALDGDTDLSHELCDKAGAIGEPFWGDSAFVLQAFGHLFSAHLSGEWHRARSMFKSLTAFSDSQLFVCPAALAHAACGDLDAARTELSRMNRPSFDWFGEHILGGNILVAAAELALMLDDDDLASFTEGHLRPYEHLMLGVPWACSLAAADPLARLAERRGDKGESERLRRTAAALYDSLHAPALAARFDRLSG